jgi:hypothetical protein
VKGAKGEARVFSALASALNPDEYVILNDLTLPTEDGTTQIDHVILSQIGIFVVETKNMSGWIFGSEEQDRWTQTFRRKRIRFQNPLRQNFKHVKTIEELLSLRIDDIQNVVVFVGSARPKTEMPANVVRSKRQLLEYIRLRRTVVFSKSQVEGYAEQLSAAKLDASRETRRAHIEGLRRQVIAKENDKNTCPKCGSSMVLRMNKETGQSFFGCSRFPKCKGTRQNV